MQTLNYGERREHERDCSRLKDCITVSYTTWGWEFINIQLLPSGAEEKWTCVYDGSLKCIFLLDRKQSESWSSEAPFLSAAVSFALQIEGGW